MKKYLLAIIVLAFLTHTYGQKSSLRAYLSHAAFNSPQHGPYLETYLSVLAKSVLFVKIENGKFQGTVAVTMLFKQNDSIRSFLKYNLKTEEISDTSKIDFIIFDQQRIPLPSGNYELNLEIADLNRDLPSFKAKDNLSVNFSSSKKIELSDIELIESYKTADDNSMMAKSGYDFIPYQDYFFPESNKKITFYAEIYNANSVLGDDAPFVVTTALQSVETGKPLENFYRIKRETANPVNIIFNEFDIAELPSGNYNLVFSIRDKENKEIASKRKFIQRSNPGIRFNINTLQSINIANSFVANITNADTLKEYIRMCFPIAGANEKLFITYNVAQGNLVTMQQFFYSFWLQRNELEPEKSWLIYYNTVLGVNEEFSTTNKKGYETDRGRVYLQYGPPNNRITETMNPDSYPYETWQYYQVGNQWNQRFVFYTRDLALNDYVILHSTVTGEVKNVNWQYDVKRSAHDMRPNDTDNSLYSSPYEHDNFGEHSGENFNFKK